MFVSTSTGRKFPPGPNRDAYLLILEILVKLIEKFGIMQLHRLILKSTQIASPLKQRRNSENYLDTGGIPRAMKVDLKQTIHQPEGP